MTCSAGAKSAQHGTRPSQTEGLAKQRAVGNWRCRHSHVRAKARLLPQNCKQRGPRHGPQNMAVTEDTNSPAWCRLETFPFLVHQLSQPPSTYVHAPLGYQAVVGLRAGEPARRVGGVEGSLGGVCSNTGSAHRPWGRAGGQGSKGGVEGGATCSIMSCTEYIPAN